VTESFLSEDVTWSRFIKVCSNEMNLREDSIPEFSWKFSNGPGSKQWTKLSESSYHRMMVAAAKRIRDRAKREPDLKDPDLGSGWRIDLDLENEVEMNEDGSGEDEAASATEKEKKEEKKKGKGKVREQKKRPKGKKRKYRERAKVRRAPIIWILLSLTLQMFSATKESKKIGLIRRIRLGE
jgi:hypothetical protein